MDEAGHRPQAVRITLLVRPMPPARRHLAAILCAAAFTPAAAADRLERSGSILSYAMPAGVLGVELWRGDTAGSLQFAQSFAATMLATAALKAVVKADRPDGSGDDGFPSGHSARAFSSAAYVHRRHGLQQAWPMYALASFVGYTRVESRQHRWGDVFGAAALSVASAWWLVDPAHGRIEVALLRDGVSVQWRLPLH
jgi:membrane-associated phospholipid phosphatase